MGLLDIALGAVTGGITSGFNDIRQYNMQEDLTNLQKEAQLDIWEKTNYPAQVEQLKKAGLNPALLYGKGGGGGATTGSISGGNAPQGGGELMKGMEVGLQSALQEAQIENLKADAEKKRVEATKIKGVETENIGQDTKNKIAQEALTKTQNKIAELQRQYEEDTMSNRQGVAEQTFQKIAQEVNILRNNTDISGATKETQIQQIKQDLINSEIEGRLKDSNIHLNRAQIQKLAADIIQRGSEIAIKQFEAEFKANHPEMRAIIGGMLNSIKSKLDKITGLGEEYTEPNKIQK